MATFYHAPRRLPAAFMICSASTAQTAFLNELVCLKLMRLLLISLVLCSVLFAVAGCGQKSKLYRAELPAAVTQT